MASLDWDSMITVGRILRPQHNRGQVVVAADTDFPAERFAPGATVYRVRDAAVETLRVAESRQHDARWIVRFDGVDSIDGAETLRGVELRVPVDALMPLGPGAYYVHDLVGCDVRTVSGAFVGRVVRVDVGSGIPLVVVEGDAGEVLVPFADVFVRQVDLAGRRIEIDPPAGLLEVNRVSRP
jgi:16S rRNA processing protein RimM